MIFKKFNIAQIYSRDDYVEDTGPDAVQASKKLYDILFPPKALRNWRREKQRRQALKIGNIKPTVVWNTRKLRLSFVGIQRRDSSRCIE